MEALSPALFLDRDGVVNQEVGYLSRPDQVQFVPGIFDLCRTAQALGYKLIIITNQSGIARELYSEADFHALMDWIAARFSHEGIRLGGYYFCPHHPEHGMGRYRQECPDRKPQPGMLLRAFREHQIDRYRSIFLGDRCSDMQAGAAAGVGTLILLAGTEPSGCGHVPGHTTVSTLTEVIELLQRKSSV
ncbi:MAG: HAD family hydrolase [Acidobacteriaceae bacterium]